MNGNSPHSTGFDPFLRPLPKKESGKCVSSGVFMVIWKLWMCSVVSLDVDEIGLSGRLGLGKNSGLPQHNFNYF